MSFYETIGLVFPVDMDNTFFQDQLYLRNSKNCIGCDSLIEASRTDVTESSMLNI